MDMAESGGMPEASAPDIALSGADAADAPDDGRGIHADDTDDHDDIDDTDDEGAEHEDDVWPSTGMYVFCEGGPLDGQTKRAHSSPDDDSVVILRGRQRSSASRYRVSPRYVVKGRYIYWAAEYVGPTDSP